MKILDWVWQSCGATGSTVGVVLCQDEFDGALKAYIGLSGTGSNEADDVDHIAHWGGSLPLDAAFEMAPHWKHRFDKELKDSQP